MSTKKYPPFRFKLKTLLLSFALISLFLCVCVLCWPAADPRSQEGWDVARVIKSKQALDVIESPDKITVSVIERVNGNQVGDLGMDSKIVAGPFVVKDPELIAELSESLAEVGKQRVLSSISAAVAYNIRLEFSRASSKIHVYVTISPPDFPFFSVYERGYYVGRDYDAHRFFTTVQDILLKTRGEVENVEQAFIQ